MGRWFASKEERQRRYEQRKAEIQRKRDERLSRYKEAASQTKQDMNAVREEIARSLAENSRDFAERLAEIDANATRARVEWHRAHAHCAQCGVCLVSWRGKWEVLPSWETKKIIKSVEYTKHEHVPSE
jgi:heterodisulfide reductase subunit C